MHRPEVQLLRPNACMNVGAELAQARRDLGLTLEEVSARTKISIERLTAIETMDSERLPSLLYLKGFLRAYATEVQLDPEILTERYVSQLDVVGPVDVAAHQAKPTAPTIAPLVAADPGEFFESEDEVVTGPAVPASRRAAVPPSRKIVEPPLDAAPATVAANPQPPVAPPQRFTEIEPDHDHSGPRVFAAYDTPDANLRDVPRRASKRYAALMLALPLSVLAGWVIGENYDKLNVDQIVQRLSAFRAAEGDRDTAGEAASDASGRRDQGRAAQPEREPAPPPAQASKPSAETRKPSAEASHTEPVSEPELVPPPDTAAARTARATRPAEQTAVPAQTTPAATPSTEPAAATRTDVDASDAARAVDTDSRVVTAKDLSGRWTLTNRVEESSYLPYKGMNVGFQLQLRQEGDRIVGTGHKWMENGKPVPASRRTPITIEGTVTGGRLQLTFTEKGARRASAGSFTLDVTDESTLSGTFESDAANTQGTSHARRAQSLQR